MNMELWIAPLPMRTSVAVPLVPDRLALDLSHQTGS
jgi:hypothetical protein